jgi:methionyl-tRNA formyltransferase
VRATRLLLFGDAPGVTQLLRSVAPDLVVGVVGASDRPQYHQALAGIAESCRAPLLIQPAWRSEGYADFVADAGRLRPDLILCNSYSMLLRDDLLALAPRGAVNLHGGKLPEYRGPNPIQWAISENERYTAATLHHMTPELDAGDVISERCVPIGFADTWRDVSVRLAAASEELLAEEVPAVLAGTAPRHPQDIAAARRWPRRTPEDGRIDWSWSVLRIYNLGRALGDGIPPAFYESDGERVELEDDRSLARIVELAYAPGPGGRRLTQGRLELVPDGGDLVRFQVLCDGHAAGAGGVEAVDLDKRRARVWADPPDPELLDLLGAFARSELGFELTEGER